jgi:RNA polymerase sigma factor (sigma-70 family)
MTTTSGSGDPNGSATRQERGLKSYQDGHSFENATAELYRLLHYEVEHSRLFSGRQIDLFLTGRFGDLTIHRAIECKAGDVNADHLDSFIAKLRLVHVEYPAVQGTIVSAGTFTDALKAHARTEGIQLTAYRDLAAQLLDGHRYARNLIRECEGSERYALDVYIEPNIGHEVAGASIAAFSAIADWLESSEWNQLTLLGDVGTGKSFLCRMLAYRMATAFLANPVNHPLPILIDLREADRQFSIEGLILTHFAAAGLNHVSFDAFQHSLSLGHLVVMFDGFDEMAARVTPQITTRNFHELARCVRGRAKVILTCRTHYFKSRTEEEEVVLGGGDNYGSATARDLYWELISRNGFSIAYLRPFDLGQIEEFVRKAKPGSAKTALARIRTTYNLMELSQRPLLLDMIVKSIDRLESGDINPATLYKVYTDAWIHRDQWRDILSPELKMSFLTTLARCLWTEDVTAIHYTRLFELVRQELGAQIQNPQQLMEIDSEVRTATFLTRDQSGNYGFAHKSYAEFFVARSVAGKLAEGDLDGLRGRRLSVEIISFLEHLVPLVKCERFLSSVLTGDYQPQVSENALVCLYGLKRRMAFVGVGEGAKEQTLTVHLPSGMKLSGAQLDQVTLESAKAPCAELQNASLPGAILRRAEFPQGMFDGCNLRKADLVDVCLTSAKLRGANLNGANCEGADFSSTDFSGARLVDAYLMRVTTAGACFDGVSCARVVAPRELLALLRTKAIDVESHDEAAVDIDNPTARLINELYPYIQRVARRGLIAADYDADDIAQMVALNLLHGSFGRKLSEMRPEDLRHHVRSMIRVSISRHRREISFSEFEDGFGFPIEGIGVDATQLDEVISAESLDLLNGAFARLSPQAARIVRARFFEGATVRAIAAEERLSESAVARISRKALDLMQREFRAAGHQSVASARAATDSSSDFRE